MYPRMIPRLSRAGFNVLAGSAPESRGRQPSSHQTSLYTHTHHVRTYTHARTQANTRARDTYLRSTDVTRARTRSPTHPELFSFVCVHEKKGSGQAEGEEKTVYTWTRIHVHIGEKRTRENAGWLVRFARVCFTRTIRRYCYFCDQALSIPSRLSPSLPLSLLPTPPFRFVFF